MAEVEMQWYVLRAVSGKEAKVKEYIDAEIPFVEGESVKVSDGPFSGFTGVIEKVDAEKKKVTVTVKVFGRSTGLDLGFTQIEKE